MKVLLIPIHSSTYLQISNTLYLHPKARKNQCLYQFYLSTNLRCPRCFGYDYNMGSMYLLTPEDDISTSINIKAKWRGGSTNSEGKHKRNYKIKTIDAQGKSKDYSFLGLRKDNNWILDAGQVDLLD